MQHCVSLVSGAASRCSAGGAPRVGQPGWACGHTPASPVLPLEGSTAYPAVHVYTTNDGSLTAGLRFSRARRLKARHKSQSPPRNKERTSMAVSYTRSSLIKAHLPMNTKLRTDRRHRRRLLAIQDPSLHGGLARHATSRVHATDDLLLILLLLLLLPRKTAGVAQLATFPQVGWWRSALFFPLGSLEPLRRFGPQFTGGEVRRARRGPSGCLLWRRRSRLHRWR